MSQWTHVCGLIRIDGISDLDGNIEQKIKDAFGIICTYDDWDDGVTAPCGSEGSVQYRIVHTGDESAVAWGVVYIWGDLRDYKNVKEIYEWVKKACSTLWVRSCAVKIEVEYEGDYLITDVYENNSVDIMLIALKGRE